MKIIISLRVRERIDCTRAGLQRFSVTAANKSHLRTWLAMLVFCLHIVYTTSARGQCSGPYVPGENPVDFFGQGKTTSIIPIVTVPYGTRVVCINVGYSISYEGSGSNIITYLKSDETDIRYLLKSGHDDGSDDVTTLGITAFDGELANQIWRLDVYNIGAYFPKITITHWWIEVYYRDEYPPNINVSPLSHDFDWQLVGSESDPLIIITISNTGEQDLHISDIKLSDETNFTLDVNGGWNPLGSTNPTIGEENSRTLTVRATGRQVMNLLPGNWGAGGLKNGGSIKTKNPVGDFSVPGDAVFF